MNPTTTGPRTPWRFRLTPGTRRFEQRRLQGESGAILLLALAFVTLVMVLVVALLGLAKTENAALRNYRAERVRRYNVDSAMEEMIQMLKDNPDLGTSSSTSQCRVEHPASDALGSGVFAVNSLTVPYIVADCAATSLSGVTSGAIESDGGQGARDVTIEISCYYDSAAPPDGLVNCGTGTQKKLIGRARVRFDIDYSVVPTAPNCNVADGCTASTVRATIPKVLTWSLRPET